MTISTYIITCVKCECFCILPHSIYECYILGRKKTSKTSIVESHKYMEISFKPQLPTRSCLHWVLYLQIAREILFWNYSSLRIATNISKALFMMNIWFPTFCIGRDFTGTSQIAEIAQKHLCENCWRKGHLNAGIASPGSWAWCQPLTDSLPKMCSQHGCANDESVWTAAMHMWHTMSMDSPPP